jgi:NAD(P)-dependent dehydrogenase (short-subunit alcohol dehydrogenase family)
LVPGFAGGHRALAYEVAPFGIQVTLVEPGNIRTDFTASRRMAASAADLLRQPLLGPGQGH